MTVTEGQSCSSRTYHHDQGYVPINFLAPRRPSALSIGAGVLLSIVGRGSAFDVAGQGVADPSAVLDTLALLHGGTPEKN